VAKAQNKLAAELENRIRFEILISDMSARFVRLPAEEVDCEIEFALKQVLEFFDVDRCGLMKVSEDKHSIYLTHAYYKKGLKEVSKFINLVELFPYAHSVLVLKGEPLITVRMSDLPPESKKDQQIWAPMGVKSVLIIPLFISQSIRYLFTIETIQREHEWPKEYIPRVTLLGEIFVNALERRDKESALRESESRLKLATDSAGVGLWTLDNDTGVFWLTNKARDLFGFAPDSEITFERFLDVVHPDDQEQIRQAMQKAPQSKKETIVEYRIVRGDGSIRWMVSRGRIHYKLSGDSNLLMGVSIDITERKRTEEELLRLREEYTHIARVSAMGELVASLAHELKQPLAAIRSNAQAALRFLTGDKADIDELHEVLKDIILDNRRADDVIGKLRKMMRKSEPQVTDLDLKELVQDILPLVFHHETVRKISLQLEFDETLPLVAGDRIQIQQVLLNLILNSTEALMNKKQESRSILVRAYQQDNRTVMLSVKDNGPGIEAQAMPHVFEAFYTTKPEGLGMGLAICRSIVEKHGGRLWVENNPDGGATFSFTIPIVGENSA
jgi:PAS domain S-box-containing protein